MIKPGSTTLSPAIVACALLLAGGTVRAAEPTIPQPSEHAPAHPLADHDTVKRLRDSGRILPLDAIIHKHQAQHRDGRILEAELEWEAGRYVYELQILHADGTVREWEYDAASGELLRVEPEH